MYGSYRYGYPSRSYNYPRYGYGGYSGYYNYGNTYRYGRRRRPYYWETDYERLLERLRRYSRTSDRDSSPEPPAPPPAPVQPPTPEPPKEEAAKVLKVESVDLDIAGNAKKHHTDEYECIEDREDEETHEQLPAELVCRRGQPIEISITFDREYKKQKHDAQIVFRKGKKPRATKGTLVTLDIDENGKTDYTAEEWGATLISGADTRTIKVKIWIPANCIIGEWLFVVTSFCDGKDKDGKPVRLDFEYEHELYINILFNPWCKDDSVYMDTEELLDEYVLNSKGCLFYGSSWSIGASPWIFGQFKNRILEVAFELVRKGFSGKESKLMSNPIFVSRAISKMVNTQNDGGVLVGNWSGKYDGGTSPTTWSGSVEILKEYRRKNKSVKYGQCWVFSGVTTTVCRALGLPCRSVTNFSSAHDTDGSCSIETHLVEVNGRLEEAEGWDKHGDSIWNFHVWNECWFARPDLPAGNNGWQVIDATPQESSEGLYQCGPCPVAAVKRGQCDTKYDTAFVFAEVGADEIHLHVHDRSIVDVIKIDKTTVGRKISTKKPDGKMSTERLDLTHDYKYPEGSAKEREAVENAQKTTINPSPAYNLVKQDQDIKFELIPTENVLIGEPLEVVVTAKNTGRRKRHISQLEVIMYPKNYTGERAGGFIFRHDFGGIDIKPGDTKKFPVRVVESEYFDYLVQWFFVHIEVLYKVEAAAGGDSKPQVGDDYVEFRFRKPDLIIKADPKVRRYERAELDVSFRNPLSVPLTNCTISFESDGFRDKTTEKLDMIVNPHEVCNFTTTAFANKRGSHTISVTFDSKELPDINGFVDMDVQ